MDAVLLRPPILRSCYIIMDASTPPLVDAPVFLLVGPVGAPESFRRPLKNR
jgi:hypothetical protein